MTLGSFWFWGGLYVGAEARTPLRERGIPSRSGMTATGRVARDNLADRLGSRCGWWLALGWLRGRSRRELSLSRNDLLRSGQRGGIPTPADRLDQLHAGHDLQDTQVHGGLLIAEERGLGGNNVEVGVDAEAVAVRGQLEAALRGLDGRVLFLNFLRKNAQGREIVLDLLKRGQDRAAIVRDHLIILRAVLFHGGATQTAIVNRLGNGRAHGPEPAWPSKPTGTGRGLEPGGSAKSQRRIKRGSCDADLRIGLRHQPLGCGDIRAALQKLRGDAEWNSGRRSFQGLDGDREGGSGLADQERNRMLIFRSQNANTGIQRAGGFQLSFGLRDGFVGVDARLIQRLGQFQGLLISHHGRIEKLFKSVLAAQLEIIYREFRVSRQPRILEVGFAGLRVGDVGANGVAHTAPQIGRPGSVEGQRVFGEGGSARGSGLVLGNDACADGNGREILRARLPHHSARRHETGKSSGDVLVGNVDLFFEGVQLGIAKNLPPVAMESAVLGLRDFPAVHLLEIVRSDLLERRRHLRRRAIVFRADIAALEKYCAAEKHGRNAHFIRCLHGCLGLLAKLALSDCEFAWHIRTCHPKDSISRCASSFPWARSHLTLKRSRERYTTGVVYRVSIWLRISPPIMAMPRGLRSSDPVPLPKANGVAPNIAAIVVIIMGRNRRMHAWKMASRGLLPSMRSAASAKSIIRMAFFLTMPINRMTPISAMMLRSL